MERENDALDLDTLTQIWAEFVYEDKMDPRVHPAIAESWRRCKAMGVDPNVGGVGVVVDESVFQSILDANKELLEVSKPIMQSVFHTMQASGCSLTLTDSTGYILELIGDAASLSTNKETHFEKGSLWSGLRVGTNAISVALDSDVAIQMVGAQHYCRNHHTGVCSAAPIHDPDGNLIGCLNLSAYGTKSAHPHSLGLVLASVQGIEGKLILRRTAEFMRMAMENGADSTLLLGEDYHPIWMNSAAQKLFDVDSKVLFQQDFRSIMPDLNWAEVWVSDKRYFSTDTRVLTRCGIHHCSVAVSPMMDQGSKVLSITLKKQKHLIAAANKMNGNRAVFTFEDIFTEDSAMKRVIALARKYAHYNGNILIEGESGTGKELFAQAIHNASNRAKGPFVVVNCASIPRDLLESELFGYEAGAFLGAVVEGNPGRFELANHGTLFLDEVGELPMEFQSKLLRAVESHRITRLGGKEEIELDMRLIAATNRNLEMEVANQAFRQELFFRLNILRLKIPALRERPDDIRYCAEKFLARLNKMASNNLHQFSPDFIDGLMEHDWPGNVRELQNGIERAFYSSDEEMLGCDALHLVFSCNRNNSKETVDVLESDEAGKIKSTLALCGGDVDATAERLGLSRATLYRRMKKYNIKPQKIKQSLR